MRYAAGPTDACSRCGSGTRTVISDGCLPIPATPPAMLFLHDKTSSQPLREIAETDVSWLLAQLEMASASAAEFHVSPDTVDALAIAGASDDLLDGLAALLDNRDGARVALVHRLSEDVYAPVVLRPTDREADEAVDQLGDDQAPAPWEIVSAPEGVTVEVAGRELSCVVCGMGRFHHRRLRVHDEGGQLLESTAPNTDCFVCGNCHYAHWFVR